MAVIAVAKLNRNTLSLLHQMNWGKHSTASIAANPYSGDRRLFWVGKPFHSQKIPSFVIPLNAIIGFDVVYR